MGTLRQVSSLQLHITNLILNTKISFHQSAYQQGGCQQSIWLVNSSNRMLLNFYSLTNLQKMKSDPKHGANVQWTSLQDFEPEKHIPLVKDFLHNSLYPNVPEV